jgi:hypothetical protein
MLSLREIGHICRNCPIFIKCKEQVNQQGTSSRTFPTCPNLLSGDRKIATGSRSIEQLGSRSFPGPLCSVC